MTLIELLSGMDGDFQACAMICTVCSDSPKDRNGFSPVNLEDDVKVYLPLEFIEP